MSHGATNGHRIRDNESHDGSCQIHCLFSRGAGQIELFLSWSKVYFLRLSSALLILRAGLISPLSPQPLQYFN